MAATVVQLHIEFVTAMFSTVLLLAPMTQMTR